MANGTHLTQQGGTPLIDPGSYSRRLIGKLLYLTATRHDISFFMQQLSQFMGNTISLHHEAAIWVLRYVKQSPTQGLFFPSSSVLQVKAFSDSDWATCPDSRISVPDYCIFIGDSLISWKSKKQHTIASTVCEVQLITFQLKELQIPYTTPALLYCDSQSAHHIASNSSFHERTKHIELDCHTE